MGIVAIIYIVLGYWAVNKVIYEGKVVIYTDGMNLFIKKVTYAIILGWLLIPIAILKMMFVK